MEHEAILHSFIAAVRRRWFVQVALRAIGQAALLAAIPIGAAPLIDALQPLDGPALVVLAIATTLLSIAAAAMVARRMPPRPDDCRVARFIEERVASRPGTLPLDDALVSAIDPGGAALARGLRRALARVAADRLKDVTAEQVVPGLQIRRAAAQALAGAAVLALAVAVARGPLVRALETVWVGLLPGSIQVEVQPGDARIVAGQPVHIRAVVRSGGRVLTRFTPSLTVSADAQQRSVLMQPEGAGFVFPFESVDRTFRYRITAGSAVSTEYTITALLAPRVRQIDLRYEYPAFTNLQPHEDLDGGDIYGPQGTRVRVRIHTDRPATSGELALGSTATAAMRSVGDRVLETQFVLARDDSYRVRLADADGLRSSGETEYFIRLVDDRPPDVRILRPAGDQQITPLEEVLIEARADDDHGISTFELVYSMPGGRTRIVPFSRTSGTEVARLGSYLLASEDLRVQPGDVITYYARARDVGLGKRPTETKSDMFFLEVRPFNEEFVAAQSQAGASGGDPELESLIAAQKEIISATWNLERRSGAGRSVTDLRAVALAQADLKARVERMSGLSGRARTPFRAPQQLRPPQPGRGARQGPDLMSEAVEAMGRAVDHLQGLRTGDALPQEMAALQSLLQAQAEVRRRQVMQQQASGAGGMGRQGQDLSALFDKELQRQQRTNYETRSQIDERPDPQSDSALDRIRDLARRQDDLSRRQRELAEAAVPAEERKRQLERLTREQTELREQVDELARQLNQQAASNGPQRSDSSSQGQASDPTQRAQGQQREGPGRESTAAMQEASEQMRSAASDLERQNPDAAAERAAQAAERLRQIEQLMRGDSPDARHRAAGELQLEAQQIAEEQRRIAAEAERLDRAERGAGADARRRLAGEKDRLADRVDTLQRGVTQLGGDTKGTGEAAPDRLREAARELEREQIGRRMRDTARQMREGGGADEPQRPSAAPSERRRLADAEQQIAQALDRVVERLGGAGPESGTLSAELGEAQAIRDRLDRLEQRIREGEDQRQIARGRESEPGDTGQRGQQGRGGNSGAGRSGELEKLREEYARELQRARETVARLQRNQARDSLGGATPERHEWSQADPGTEAFKQDYSGWQSLRRDVNEALERYESAVSAQIAEKAGRDRLNAGGSDRVPDAYRKLIARYYEALARSRR